MKINLTKFENPITPEPGIYENVPFSEYQKWNCFSKSMVGPALKSGRHLKHYIKRERKTAALNFGSLVDCIVLEPHLFDDEYTIQPAHYLDAKGVAKPWNMRSNTCKAIAAENAASGKQLAKQDDIDRARACRDALKSNEIVNKALQDGCKQVSVVWIHPETGVLCKGRFDVLGNTIDDLKTAADASESEFSFSMRKYFYHVQAGIYTEAWEILKGEIKNFRFIVVETGGQTEIPEVAIYTMDLVLQGIGYESIIAGRLMFKRACQKIVHYENNGFTGYSQFEEPIEIDRWAIEREFAKHSEVNL